MGMKRPRVLAIYRAGSPQPPAAATDALILSAARARHSSRAPARLAMAAAVAVAAIFAARWMLPGAPSAPEITNFGLEEGQAHAWLTTWQPPLNDTGPGSREGMTP